MLNYERKVMIGRRSNPPEQADVEDRRSFDDFELRLGDIMRGERATFGKSLLDVQRDLKIKASYIAAIENSDPTAFETPGFIAGYVRSYARYLELDPEWAFKKFCEEGSFAVAHGLSSEASGPKPPKIANDKTSGFSRDPFSQPNTPFVPSADSIFSRIEPSALGSVLVLVALIGFIGYGGWAVLQEVQRVQLAPVDQTPGVTAEVDPLAPSSNFGTSATTNDTQIAAPSQDALNRLYRPQTLDVPVLTARDAPIAMLDPSANATVVEASPEGGAPGAINDALAEALGEVQPVVQVTEQGIPEVVMFASRPAWVRVTSTDGTVIYEKILDASEGWALPKTETPPLLRTGNAGAIYFAVGGETYGPAGEGASIGRDIALSAEDLRAVYGVTEELTNVDVGAIIQEAVRRRDAAASQ